MAKRTLSDEENALWQQVKKTTRPLRKEPPKTDVAPVTPKKSATTVIHQPIQRTPIAYNTPHLVPGSYDNIDTNTATRFRKGKQDIDATLDLHGMTHDKAHAAFSRFIKTAYTRQNRTLLVITGKGTLGTGLLRRMLPEWINDDDIRGLVLAFDVAKPHHGGSGAYTILLKRKR